MAWSTFLPSEHEVKVAIETKKVSNCSKHHLAQWRVHIHKEHLVEIVDRESSKVLLIKAIIEVKSKPGA